MTKFISNIVIIARRQGPRTAQNKEARKACLVPASGLQLYAGPRTGGGSATWNDVLIEYRPKVES